MDNKLDSEEEPEILNVLAEVAGLSDFDPAAIQGDENLECYDDLRENWEERSGQEHMEGKIFMVYFFTKFQSFT